MHYSDIDKGPLKLPTSVVNVNFITDKQLALTKVLYKHLMF